MKKAGLIIGMILFNLGLGLAFYVMLLSTRDYAQGIQFYREMYPRFHSILFWLADFFYINLFFLIISFFLVNFYLLRTLSIKLLKNTISIVFGLFLGLLFLEIGLRFAGYIPGKLFNNKWFNNVDKLQHFSGIEADSLGIMKVNSVAAQEINQSLVQNRIIGREFIDNNNLVFEVYCLSMDYSNMPDNSLNRKIQSIKKQSQYSTLDSAILNYSINPINTDGFRSIEFKEYNVSNPSVLLLGDSFTWGHSTTNKTNSFADELLAKGYVVYNTGITATDPAQYLAIAKKYIPKLNPDFVIVNFYMGNDVVYFNRKPMAYKPLYYYTNAGVLMACPQGVYFDTMEETYNFTKNSLNLPSDKNQFNWLCSKTVIGTFFWRILSHFYLVDNENAEFKNYYEQVELMKTDLPSNIEINEIQQLAVQYHSTFYLSVFPDINNFGNWVKPEDIPGLFDTLPYLIADFKKSDYDLSNNHLNDSGNYKYARFLDSLMSK